MSKSESVYATLNIGDEEDRHHTDTFIEGVRRAQQYAPLMIGIGLGDSHSYVIDAVAKLAQGDEEDTLREILQHQTNRDALLKLEEAVNSYANEMASAGLYLGVAIGLLLRPEMFDEKEGR